MDDFFKVTYCTRCKTSLEGKSRIMSKMNEDVLCEGCKQEETKHPNYKEACEAEINEVKKGNYNYKGLFNGKVYPFNK